MPTRIEYLDELRASAKSTQYTCADCHASFVVRHADDVEVESPQCPSCKSMLTVRDDDIPE